MTTDDELIEELEGLLRRAAEDYRPYGMCLPHEIAMRFALILERARDAVRIARAQVGKGEGKK